ncbi:Isotrichodermin C-15 hydroxylase [Daldinia childiae]|uniref:Isotrichodermin C-15 hydroxylase n=1 Tax=Daldinia childiae TaxID=326645 RepID=UPI00144551B5|nr:Isotrichodermin C-15 hydroxylase [Daldinia childiae]KAF3064163.1 Isotrichodermin C-15 hydroxylase [Daldinia childiae]
MAPVFEFGDPVNIPLIGAACLAIYVVGNIFYRLFLDPLRSIPGPFLWRFTNLPRVYHILKGDIHAKVLELHVKYGPVLRLTPYEVVFSDPQAWKDIYGHRVGDALENPKWPQFYKANTDLAESFFTAERKEHAIQRRQLSHGFSDKSMREQESLIKGYVELLIQRLHENAQNGAARLNMRDWYNWTTFDVIGDLGFGRSFGCLADTGYHPWVKLITQTFRESAAFQSLAHLGLRPVVKYAYRLGLMVKNKENLNLVAETLQERIKLGKERPDLIDGFVKKKDELGMSFESLVSSANLLIVAGSETTATLLSGATFLLTTNPDKLAKVTEEVRSCFESDQEITLTSVSRLPYMLACLNEALRQYPPATSDLPRVTPKGGATILGRSLPEGTVVSVFQYAVNYDPRFWKNPFKFAPERWLDDPEYKDDQQDAMQPFSTGPRNCIGRNLAYAEMRLILAKILFNFDMSIDDESLNWFSNQRAFSVWEKPPLYIHLTPVTKKSE